MDAEKTFNLVVNDKTASVTLRPIMDMAVSEDFLQLIKFSANAGHDLIFKSDQVKRISTPCLQILMAAQIDAEKSGRGFAIENPSEDLKKAINDLGLTPALDKWRI